MAKMYVFYDTNKKSITHFSDDHMTLVRMARKEGRRGLSRAKCLDDVGLAFAFDRLKFIASEDYPEIKA